MSTVINTNPAATIASYNLKKTSQEHERSLNRLSSGSRINSSYEDAAGLAVSMKMDSQIRNLDALDKNLANAKSFLETQDGALRIVAKILQRIEELEMLKKDVTKNDDDISLYNTEINQLKGELTNIRESKFNGVRLFSPTNLMDSIQASTSPLDSSEVDLFRPPLPIAGMATKAIEVVFVVDVSGSMGGDVDNLKSNIESFVNNLEATGQPWKVKVVSFSDVTESEPIETSGWATDLDSVRLALNSTLNMKSGVDEPESMIDGLANAINHAGWTPGSDVIRKIVSFTDATSKVPEASSGTIDSISGSAVSQDISIDIYGLSADPVTSEFASKSGATLKEFIRPFGMSAVLGDLTDSFYSEDVFVDLNLVAKYIAQNGATQSEINTAIDRTKTNALNLTSAKSRILDVDVAQESSQLARTKVLLEAGTAMLAQANQSTQSILRLLQLN
jgi:flagellin